MQLTRGARRHVIASLVLIAGAGLPAAAKAQTLMTRLTAFMHSGPGMQFAVTDEIPNGTPLTPDTCANGWCRIRYGNALGWVDQSVLGATTVTAQPKPGERPIECMDFARTGWPDAGDLDRVCIFPAQKTPDAPEPAG